MFSIHSTRVIVGGALLASLAFAACSPAATPTPAPRPTQLIAATPTAVPAQPTATAVLPPPTPVVLSSATKAAGLRVALDRLLEEHVLLASSTTAAALANRTKEFEAAAAALDTNSVDLAKTFGAIYGADAEKNFLAAWRKHIGFVVDYTTGVAKKDKAAQDKAISNLNAYADDFGTLIAALNPNLPKAAVAELFREHIKTLKAVIDAQAAGDYAKAYAALGTAFDHMSDLAKGFAGGIALQFPDKFDGSVEAGGANLRSGLTSAFDAHVYLLNLATAAGFGGRDADFKAAAASLDASSANLGQAISFVYGDAAGNAFLPLWRKHIGFVMDYTGALAIKDKAKQDQALSALNAYADDFGAFLNSASPALPKAAVSDLVRTHILTLKEMIDAQAAGDYAKAYPALRKAYAHMSAIADPLADAIVKQFPDKFK